ncbi:MAG: glutamate--tRNA ligase [Parcubacteria group bacterium]
MIRTRFAPSPTGELHIGGARSALFVYLFAKSQGGEFLLRIDDTDMERFVEGSPERIIESLKWLDILPDNINNVIFQSKRVPIYKSCALELVKQGHAYICTCSEEELKREREEQIAKHLPPMYGGHCRDLNIKPEDVGESRYVIRMKMPKSGIIKFHDLIRGDIEFDASLVDDQVLIKSDGYPTYHLATVVDDHEMDITHVLRAEEWLPSTPKHLTLFKMFGWKEPEFAHLPQVLAPDRTKLSKRHGATSVIEYKNLGYLPEAVLNFLVLLGWHPKDDREIFSKDDLIKEFDLFRVQKSGAVFDSNKLNWLNKKYISEILPTEEIMNRGQKFMPGNWRLTAGIMNAVKTRLEKLSDLENAARLFFITPEYPADMLYWKGERRGIRENLENILTVISTSVGEFNKENLEAAIFVIIPSNGKGEYLWPLRVALSGQKESPGPFEIMEGLGKEESMKRIKNAIGKL